MSSKEQTHGNDKTSSKQRGPKSATENLDIVAQQQPHPATIIQRIRLDPNSLTASDVQQLQRTLGNRAVGRLLAQTARHQPVQERSLDRSGVQARMSQGGLVPVLQGKPTIGQPNDRYEQEADAVAATVVEQINSPRAPKAYQGQPTANSAIQREEMRHEECDEIPMKALSPIQREEIQDEGREELQLKPQMQRRPDGRGDASADLESAIARARGSGQPLDPDLQAQIGQAMGADFSGVRVHTDAQSDQLNQSIQAKAFTTGQDVFFRHGAYQPGSRGGQKLIAHELTHVVQQSTKIRRQEDESQEIYGQGLIVEDSIEGLLQGQMRKSEFLEKLYQELYRVGTEEYKGTNLTVDECPYIEYWFSRYRKESCGHIERALLKYVGGSSTVGSADQLIELISARARAGFKVQVQTGEITELPDDVPEDVGKDIVPEKELIVQTVREDEGKYSEVRIHKHDQAYESDKPISDGVIQRGRLFGGRGRAPQVRPHMLAQGKTDIARVGERVVNVGTTVCGLVLGFNANGQVACFHWPSMEIDDENKKKFADLVETIAPINKIVIITNDFLNEKERSEYLDSARAIQEAWSSVAMDYFVLDGQLSSSPAVTLGNGTVVSLSGTLRQEI